MQDAEAYKSQVVANAEGDVARFNGEFRQSLRAEKTILTAIRESLDLSDDTVAKPQ